MIGGKNREKVSSELILSKVDDYNIIKHYFGDFEFRKKYSSPFREKGVDNKPNLVFFKGHDERILFKDFANGKGGDCFKFIEELFEITFTEALHKIYKDLNLPKNTFKINITKRTDSIHKQSKLIQIIPKESFTQEELDYWGGYHITEQELKNKNVFSIKKLYISKQLVPNYKKELRFAYLFDNYLKIYSPLSQDYKWISSCPNNFISGFDDIKHKIFSGTQNKRLIISKSVKDELILKKFFKDVCSTQNESPEAITEEDMNWILKGYKPQDIFIAYDNDKTGIEGMTYFNKKYGFSELAVPLMYRPEGIKDWADLVKLKGLKTMENILNIKNLN